MRRPDESFSHTIERVIKRPGELLKVVERLGKDPLSDDAIDAIEKVVAARRRPVPTRSRKRAG